MLSTTYLGMEWEEFDCDGVGRMQMGNPHESGSPSKANE